MWGIYKESILPVGIQSNGIVGEHNPGPGFNHIKASGMTCIDYNLTYDGYRDSTPGLAFYSLIREAADDAGITVHQVHAPLVPFKLKGDTREVARPELAWRNADHMLEEHIKSIDIAAALGSRYLVIHPFQTAEFMGEAGEQDFNYEYFSILKDAAESRNICICLENMPYRKNGRNYPRTISFAEKLSKLVMRLNSDHSGIFGVCFDTGHANVMHLDLGEEIKILGEHLKTLHIHDNDGNSDTHQLPYSFSSQGECTTGWKSFVMALKAVCFRGAIVFETFQASRSLPGTLQDAYLKYLYEIGWYFAEITAFDKRIKEISQNRRIVLFGAGKMLPVYMEQFGKYDWGRPELVVDNDSNQWGKVKNGTEISPPQKILEIPSNERCVVIASRFYDSIVLQLEKMGIYEYVLCEEVLRMTMGLAGLPR